MKMSGVQRVLLLALVASLIAGAALALYVVLVGSLGDTGWQVLGTTIALAGFSITGMAACVPPRGGSVGFVARAGLGASTVSFALCAYFIWVNDTFDTDTISLAKVLAIAIIAAIAFAHAALILRGRGRNDATDTVIVATLLCTGTLAGVLSVMVLAERFGDGLARLIAALAILAVLGTLLTPLLPRILGTSNASGSE